MTRRYLLLVCTAALLAACGEAPPPVPEPAITYNRYTATVSEDAEGFTAKLFVLSVRASQPLSVTLSARCQFAGTPVDLSSQEELTPEFRRVTLESASLSERPSLEPVPICTLSAVDEAGAAIAVRDR